jgi:L-rhamnose mutarotase
MVIMERHAVIFKFKKGADKQKYKQDHQNIPAEMTALFNKAGKKNFSIWNYEDILVMYYECEDDEEVSRIFHESPEWHAWQEKMGEYIESEIVPGHKTEKMEMMFYHE